MRLTLEPDNIASEKSKETALQLHSQNYAEHLQNILQIKQWKPGKRLQSSWIFWLRMIMNSENPHHYSFNNWEFRYVCCSSQEFTEWYEIGAKSRWSQCKGESMQQHAHFPECSGYVGFQSYHVPSWHPFKSTFVFVCVCQLFYIDNGHWKSKRRWSIKRFIYYIYLYKYLFSFQQHPQKQALFAYWAFLAKRARCSPLATASGKESCCA